ncbi:MAG: hypothetical protein PVJ21_23390 [Anaerolineales bacterium]|jgi:membrane-bound metal-dependent hydrolase YbcI (DUF457 family)
MGPGHLGVAFAAKPLAPKAPLWTLLVASEALDLLSAGFIAIGMEKMAVRQMDLRNGLQIITPGWIPWSHELFMSVVWSVLFAAIAYLIFKDRKASGMIGLITFSHWILDFFVHPPDLPVLFRNSPELGLGLWSSGPGLVISLILEIILIGVGVAIYLRWRKKKKA